MRRKLRIFAVLGLSAMVAVMLIAPGVASAGRDNAGGPHARPVIFVTGQQLYFDSIVTADPVPPNGPFQDLIIGANGLETEFGPGDQGYLGGRWRLLDTDGTTVIKYFLCPLLGPGRETVHNGASFALTVIALVRQLTVPPMTVSAPP